jgi:hypothetical protein
MQHQIDLDLQEPLSGDRYQVQVKSEAGKSELVDCEKAFARSRYRSFYLVVHSPDPSIDDSHEHRTGTVCVIGPRRLAGMVLDAGLITWVLNKVH